MLKSEIIILQDALEVHCNVFFVGFIISTKDLCKLGCSENTDVNIFFVAGPYFFVCPFYRHFAQLSLAFYLS